MIKPQWLELPISRTYFHGPKDVQAIEIRLYMLITHTGSTGIGEQIDVSGEMQDFLTDMSKDVS